MSNLNTQALAWIFLIAMPFFAACTPAASPAQDGAPEPLTTETISPGTCGLSLPAEADDQTRIHALIQAEGQLMAAREIGPLMALWAEDSQVINAKNAPDNEDDFQIWRGKDAIRHRYLNVVFPSAPEVVSDISLEITVEGDEAVASGMAQIMGETTLSGDRWLARRIDNCWQIAELTYNLEPAASTAPEPDAPELTTPQTQDDSTP